MIGVEAGEVGHGSSAADDDHHVPLVGLIGNLLKGRKDAFLYILSLHDGGEKLHGKAEMIRIVPQMMAEVAITGSGGRADNGNALRERRKGKALVVMQDAVLVEPSQDFPSLLCQASQGVRRVNVRDVERIAVGLVEGELHLEQHPQSGTQFLSALLKEAQPQDVILPRPAMDSRPCQHVAAVSVLLYDFAIEMAVASLACLAQFPHDPQRVGEGLFHGIAHQGIELVKGKGLHKQIKKSETADKANAHAQTQDCSFECLTKILLHEK